MKFVILIHPLEVKRRIATGRMSHLILQDSHLVQGEDYTDDKEVNAILEDPTLHPVILYPGRSSTDLSAMAPNERASLFPASKRLAVFVIDGTWNTARKMMHVSRNLHGIEQVRFSLPTPSRFRVRKQPAEGCFSTIEAIHQAIELIGPGRGFDLESRAHDNLMGVFDHLVEQQLEQMKRNMGRSPGSTYRRVL